MPQSTGALARWPDLANFLGPLLMDLSEETEADFKEIDEYVVGRYGYVEPARDGLN